MSSADDQTHARLTALADGIAAELGGDWHREDRFRHAADVVRGDNDGFTLLAQYPNANRGRFEVVGLYPHAVDRNGRTVDVGRIDRPRIGASMDRDPAALARDIGRRFLPAYEESRAEYVRRLAAAEAAEAGQAASIARLEAVLGRGLNWLPVGPGHGRFTVGHDGTTGGVDLSGVPLDLVERIAELCQGWETGR